MNKQARLNMSLGQKGKKHSEKTKLKISRTMKITRPKKFYFCSICDKQVSAKRYKICIECNIKNRMGKSQKRPSGKLASNYKDGRTLKKYFCKECKKLLSKNAHKQSGLCRSCTRKGKKSPLYIHGRGYTKYPKEFTQTLREKIRKRDNYTCQGCNLTQKEHFLIYNRDIEIHHIDSNRKNCKENNLIVVCKQCNLNAKYNRKYWINFYNDKIKDLIYDTTI